MTTYLVTGATGSVGTALVPILLEDEEIGLRLLVRADSDPHLGYNEERIRGEVARLGLIEPGRDNPLITNNDREDRHETPQHPGLGNK